MTNANFKILLIDADAEALALTKKILEQDNFIVYTALNSKQGLEIAFEQKPELILLEMLMPELDGIDICIELRQKPELINTLIAFCSTRDEDYSQIAAFNAGADDYIIKPVKQRVLLSRIKALLKRHPKKQEKIIQNTALGLTIDREKYLIYLDGKELIFPRKEFELLALLSATPGKVYTRKEISLLIWGQDLTTSVQHFKPLQLLFLLTIQRTLICCKCIKKSFIYKLFYR